jgi:2-oxoglutarate dehydrogenase complex dehydrogenase (E1) component-like enzyme
MKNQEIKYVGRAISASTATGYGKTHKAELTAFLAQAFA